MVLQKVALGGDIFQPLVSRGILDNHTVVMLFTLLGFILLPSSIHTPSLLRGLPHNRVSISVPVLIRMRINRNYLSLSLFPFTKSNCSAAKEMAFRDVQRVTETRDARDRFLGNITTRTKSGSKSRGRDWCTSHNRNDHEHRGENDLDVNNLDELDPDHFPFTFSKNRYSKGLMRYKISCVLYIFLLRFLFLDARRRGGREGRGAYLSDLA